MEKKPEVLNCIEEIVWNISDNKQGVKEIYALFKQETERLQSENERMREVIKEAATWIEREADELVDTKNKGAAAVMYMRLAPLTEILERIKP